MSHPTDTRVRLYKTAQQGVLQPADMVKVTRQQDDGFRITTDVTVGHFVLSGEFFPGKYSLQRLEMLTKQPYLGGRQFGRGPGSYVIPSCFMIIARRINDAYRFLNSAGIKTYYSSGYINGYQYSVELSDSVSPDNQTVMPGDQTIERLSSRELVILDVLPASDFPLYYSCSYYMDVYEENQDKIFRKVVNAGSSNVEVIGTQLEDRGQKGVLESSDKVIRTYNVTLDDSYSHNVTHKISLGRYLLWDKRGMTAEQRIERLERLTKQPYLGGRQFGRDAGSYVIADSLLEKVKSWPPAKPPDL